MATSGQDGPIQNNLNDAIANFQQQIGAYDKELWEEHVEQKESQGLGADISGVQLKIGRVKTELIDVDLVRGSTFTKAKPEHAWLATTRKGLFRVFFFPFFFTWWRQQLSGRTFYSLLILYLLQGLCLAIFFFHHPTTDKELKSFFEEHLHVDEEIRFCLDGSGYFDFRDWKEQWVRIKFTKGDFFVLPAGIYHRFTLDTNDYVVAKRLFVGEPVWTPYNRPADDKPERAAYLESIKHLKEA